MNWNFSCRKTRRLLALSAGNDLEDRDLAGAQRHLAVCPSCREIWQGLRESQQVLEQVGASLSAHAGPAADEEPVATRWPAGSIWPAVSRHLRSIDAQVAAPNWRGWLPTGALAAACVAVLMVALPDGPSASSTARRRDLPTVLPKLFVAESDPETLSRLPILILPDPDGDSAQSGRERFGQPLPVREEPRSF